MKRKTTLEDVKPRGNESAALEETGEGEPGSRIDRVKTRIAGDYYERAHVKNRILKALLSMLDPDE